VRWVVVLPVKHHVVFYCPDRHIAYDGRTPDRVGVGGGITARVRMARALRRLGHRVTMVVNCPRPARIDGVDYRPLDSVHRLEGDVLVANTSGGALDLSEVALLEPSFRLTILWVSGAAAPRGLDRVGYDLVYAKSNFLRSLVLEQWGVPAKRVFVAYNGFEESLFHRAERMRPRRNPFRLVYLSHPCKGLETAQEVLARLRRTDSRFHMRVYGGRELWGEKERDRPSVEGVAYEGVIGQARLARRLFECGFAIGLHSVPEGFGNAITESMRAGCVVIASPVGAHSELIDDGRNGFIIPGHHESDQTRDQAVSIILGLLREPDRLARVRRNAQALIWDSDMIARVWSGHWDWLFDGVPPGPSKSCQARVPVCIECGGEQLTLADGHHCLGCGRYAMSRYGVEGGPVDVR
jgi:glycosyltransferase involved in cell wall biosynthesis